MQSNQQNQQNVLRIFFHPLEDLYNDNIVKRPQKNEKDVYICLYKKNPFPEFFKQFIAKADVFISDSSFTDFLSVVDEVRIQKDIHRLSLKDESIIIYNIYEANILRLENYLKKATKDDTLFSLIKR